MELRRLRERAGITVERAASALECSQSKISRLETGKGIPRTRDVRDLLRLYGDPGELREEELLQLAREGQDTKAWWNSFRDVAQEDFLPDHLLRLVALEQGAESIRAYSPLIIAGLLQSGEYIRAIIDLFYPTSSQRDRDRYVEFRTRRQDVLRRAEQGPLKFSVIMCESVLLRDASPPGVMLSQLSHLLEVIEDARASVEVRIVPFAAGLHRGLIGPFNILRFSDPGDQDVVYLEGAEGALYIETLEGVERYEEIFRAIEEKALSVGQSSALIRRIVESLREGLDQ